MNLVLLGPPGAGKGTQAVALTERSGVPRISSGDLLRAVAQRDDDVGRTVANLIDQGRMVPDALIQEMIWERLRREDARGGFLLDGFPRTVAQAVALEQFLSGWGTAITAAVDIDVTEGELVRRLAGRRNCPRCGRSYHDELRPPVMAGRCDADGEPLQQRVDDREEAIRERLRLYRERTEPVLAYYEARLLLLRVSGSGPVGAVTDAILDRVREMDTRSCGRSAGRGG